jgi:ribosome-associated protein
MAVRKHTSGKAPAAKQTSRTKSAKPTAQKSPAARKKSAAKSRPAPKPRAAKKAARASASERAITDLTRRMVAAAAAACEDKKGEDTRILELDPVADSGFTDFFLITSGTNERQTQTIADEVELRLKRDFQTYPNSVEGKRLGEWILLDYVDFVVHIFLAEKRAFYDIERLRKSARSVDAAELQNALKQKTASARKRVAGRTATASA